MPATGALQARDVGDGGTPGTRCRWPGHYRHEMPAAGALQARDAGDGGTPGRSLSKDALGGGSFAGVLLLGALVAEAAQDLGPARSSRSKRAP
ncbi:hypothetical protein CYMTET_49502 [Cymbomonas tetramitiformis]|uniref:Uncharacterized protein n=1 Tax=Cymbomonas tetramitiformis TaxID=36881 RepID=A0AAE0BRS4_9CHLO|nr:hypothetical protein CYMTET_49502 [Cymbomonas tetramitiformis]